MLIPSGFTGIILPIARAEKIKNAQIIKRMQITSDGESHRSHAGSCQWGGGEQGGDRIGFFQVLHDRQ